MKQYLFAYGTLAENAPEKIADAVEQLKYVGEGFIRGRLYDLGAYPGAIWSGRAEEKVFGKIFELPSDRGLLARLDAYEGFIPDQPRRSLFVRKRTTIGRPRRDSLKGWVYEYNREVKSRPIIRNGQSSRFAFAPRSEC